jgi:hypothetical protein
VAPPVAATLPQAACQPPSPPPATQPNIFTEEQENDLGDAIAESMAPQLRIINNDPLTAELKRVGDRLARHLPPTKLKLQFTLVDLPELNAFVLPRRPHLRLAQADRLHPGRRRTRRRARPRDGPPGRAPADPVDDAIVSRRHWRHPGRRSQGHLREIQPADGQRQPAAGGVPARRQSRGQGSGRGRSYRPVRRGRLGYDPQAHARLFDRFTETKGNTGGFFSDLFGTTSLESKRLREMLRTTSALPQSCVEARPATADESYRQWQANVIAFTPTGRTEALHNVESRTVLQPGLRGDVTHARFSPDGRYLLAQDDSGITVLSREPLATLFRIPSGEAENARFSGDSQLVTFHTPSLRVEIWNRRREEDAVRT